MLNSLKRLDKKFLVMVGFIIGLPIIIIVFLAVIRGCGNVKITHENYEQKMISAFEKYINDTDKTPTEEGETLTVELSTLVEEGYIKSTQSLLDDDTCSGSVSVRRNGSSVEANNGGYLNYTVDLSCDGYVTVHLVDKLKEELTTEDSGLYQDGDGYIYKGKKPKNYITFFGINYRIMSIDKNGILKLVKSEPEAINRVWDNKFNVDTNRSSGKNIYKDSLILEFLLNDYDNVKKISIDAKPYIVAYNACIGRRSANDYSIDSAKDCAEVLEKQVISLLSISDYAKASLDSDCVGLNSLSCNNYNYLHGVASSTWTSNVSLDNTYEVLYLSDGRISQQNANTSNYYNIVIYIDGELLYTSGSGSLEDPYVIE